MKVLPGIVLACCIFCISCGLMLKNLCSASTDKDAQQKMIISEQDNGKEIAVGCGDRFEIELEQTGGTGYAWHMTDLNTDYIRLLGEETKPMSEGAVGGSVRKIWRFETLKSGTTRIVMKHYRVWEGADRATGTFSVTLLIR